MTREREMRAREEETEPTLDVVAEETSKRPLVSANSCRIICGRIIQTNGEQTRRGSNVALVRFAAAAEASSNVKYWLTTTEAMTLPCSSRSMEQRATGSHTAAQAPCSTKELSRALHEPKVRLTKRNNPRTV